jgi:DNA repair protein RadD
MSGLLPLRPLQERAMSLLRESLKAGKKRTIIQAACGFGKTVISAHIVAGALKKGKKVAFVAPFISLIDQTFTRFAENGIDMNCMGVLQGNHPRFRPDAPVQICSIQTIQARGWPNVDFAVVDEVHIRHRTLDRWMDAEMDKIFVGLSATPWSVGLKARWNDLIIPTSIKELIEQGWLSPFRCFAPSRPDLSGVKTVAGEYHEGQLSEVMSRKEIVGDVVQTWLEKADRRPTLVFAVDRAHADTLFEGFKAEGVRTAYVDALTPREERTNLGRMLGRGELEVICSISTMTHGVDLDIRCISFARPTKSETMWVQCIGRALRTAPGKIDALILDHSNTALTLGLPTDIVHTTLKGGKDDPVRDMERPTPKPHECPECKFVIPPMIPECPNCGYRVRRVTPVTVAEGELIEFEKAVALKVAKKENRDWNYDDKRHFYGQLRGYAWDKGYKDGWASMKYKEKFGAFPNDPRVKYAKIESCSEGVRSWIRSRQIAFAKSNRRDMG